MKDFFMIIFFLCAIGKTWGDTDTTFQGTERPLRSQIPQDIELYSQSSFVNAQASLLLTQENLEQPLTVQYINRYSNRSGIEWLNSVIKNSSLYLPFVRNEIAQRGLPPELAYLPFIESNYLGTAKSKSGAVGLWQFMMNSITPFDLKVNDLIDERRDFRKSTIAALQKLSDNFNALGDWELALAAYNAGLGGIQKIIQQSKIENYWTLCEEKQVKTETIHYVPKLLAVSYILSRPREFGLDYWPESYKWTAIKLPRQVSLDMIALETGTDRYLLGLLNLELLHGITPPDSSYELKVPLAKAEAINQKLEDKNSVLLRYYRYTIGKGDTLYALALHYGVSLEMIEQHNPGVSGRYLKVGEILTIPAYKESPAYTAEKIPVANSAAQNREGIVFNGTHKVKEGETLWSLARMYKVDIDRLASENNLDLNQILSIGKELKVPIINR
ncbi:MAG: LysM peptidoglycan-binding domain-containing protein [Treponema sp.]|nr:LysM peptidoglycan-binding domain-containing protein [Treponema sp.]